MNRRITTFLVFAALAVWLGTFNLATAQVASIGGTVFNDLNANSLFDTGEELAGVGLQIYSDDGDGVFDASLDSLSGSVSTDLNGLYDFVGLNMTDDYFVVQGAQSVAGLSLLNAVSSLLEPIVHTHMVDDFSSQQLVQGDPISPTGSTNLATSGVIGGQRDLLVEYFSGSAEARFHASPYGFDQVLQFDQSAGVIARALVTWDGIDFDLSSTPALGGLAGMDFSDSEAFMFDLGVDAAGAGEAMFIRIFSGNDVSTASVVMPVTNGTATLTQVVPFSSFIGNASFSSVDAIQIEIGGNMPSIDAQLGAIELISGTNANFAVEAVPEPASGMLGLMTCACLFHFLRRRRQPS